MRPSSLPNTLGDSALPHTARIADSQQHPPAPTNRPGSRLCRQLTPPRHFPKPLPTHPHFGGAGESAGFAAGSRTPRPPPRACPGPSPRPAGPHAAYLEAGAAAAHLPAAYRKPNSGRWPSCRTLLCQRRSGRVAGAECATGQNGGMAYFLGGTRLIVWGGRAVCGLGRARCCTFRGGKGIGK